jgi:hypothetical protein
MPAYEIVLDTSREAEWVPRQPRMWVAVATRTGDAGGRIILTSECRSLAELEAEPDRLQHDLRAVQFCDFGRPWARRRSRLRALV